ncbi:MAG: helicase-associated domain-containing protein, partial [Actinomycetes bacterium]
MVARSLAEDLRTWSDDDLAALLAARPDLVTPVPADIGVLATRAGTRASVARALETLDRFALQVLDGLVHLPDGASVAELRDLLDVPDEMLRPALDRLRALCLAWGDDAQDDAEAGGDDGGRGDGGLRLVRAVREIVGSPAGLGPPAETALAAYSPTRLRHLLDDLGLAPTGDPTSGARAVAGLLGDRSRMADLVARANDPTRRLLDDLAWGAPVRTVSPVRADVRAADASTAVEWLVAHGLLVATAPDEVVVPREVAVHLRGGRLHATLEPSSPPLETVPRDVALVDRTAAGNAFTVTRAVEGLLELWSVEGPPVLRAGGLGIRELRRTATLLDQSEETLALLAETAYAAGLLAPSGDVDEVWLPSPAYDVWLARSVAERWTTLAEAWLGSTRVPGLVGSRDEKDRPLNALGAGLDSGLAPAVRHTVLDLLASLDEGHAASGESVADRLRWERPRRGGSLRERLVGWTLHEAEALGLTGRGALASYARVLRDGDVREAAPTLDALLPEPVAHVLLQADLTAVAPGPLESGLAREVALAADVESTGGATVYRFTESSIRRALDSGRTADDLHRLLDQHSATPVPQPLTYLVDDVARRHGHLRVGTASAYLRSDDEAVLNEVLADRRAASLGLRRLAPTVLASNSPVDVLLERLRGLGLAPMAESPDGTVVITRPDSRRSPPRGRPARVAGEPTP